jgi:hypothetical protein
VVTAWPLVRHHLFVGHGRGVRSRARKPPLTMVLPMAAPLIAFIAASSAYNRFHEFVLGLDLRFLTTIPSVENGPPKLSGFAHLWDSARVLRLAGRTCDMAVGATASRIILALMRRPAFARLSWPGISSGSWISLLPSLWAASGRDFF